MRNTLLANKSGSLSFEVQNVGSSIFFKLEVLPKAIYKQQSSKVRSGVFNRNLALHIAAALAVGATEFITNEKPEKSIHRTQSIKVISIHSI